MKTSALRVAFHEEVRSTKGDFVRFTQMQISNWRVNHSMETLQVGIDGDLAAPRCTHEDEFSCFEKSNFLHFVPSRFSFV